MCYQHATQLVIWAISAEVVLMQTLWFLFLEFIFSAKKLCLLKKFWPENLFLLFYHKLLVTTIDLIFLIFLILHILVVFLKQWKVPTSKCIKDHFFCFQKCQCTVFLFFHVRISCSFTTDKFSSLFYNCVCSLFGKSTVTMLFPIVSAKLFVVLNVEKSWVVFYLLWKIFALSIFCSCSLIFFSLFKISGFGLFSEIIFVIDDDSLS